jgi:hypothetical protein
LYGGKATTPVGLASSLGRNYKRYAACGRRAQHLEDPEHQGVLREDIVGEREELQKDTSRRSAEGAGLGEEAQFDIPEEIQGYRGCVRE